MEDGPAGRAAILPWLIVVLAVAAGAVRAEDAGAASPADRDAIRRIVVQEALASRRVPPSLALAVAEAESDFTADAESPAGARGVMQIMPATGRGEFGESPEALWDPRLNARLGVAFLDRLIARYGDRWDLALSHYNGGSRVGSGGDARVIPETRAYVDKVLRLERRNARDEAVARLAAAEESALATAAGARKVPPRSVREAETWLDAGSEFPNRRPPPDVAEAARDVAGFEPRWRRRAAGSAELLGWIDTRKRRFRALLAAQRGG